MAAANTASVPDSRNEISRLKKRLGIARLALQVHSASFPERIEAGGRGEDFGRGSPYSYGAEHLYEWAAELGFDTIQLGPLGMTGRGNPSPYDATIFSRNPLDLPLARMVDAGRLSAATFESLYRAVRRTPGAAVRYSLTFDAQQSALAEIISNVSAEDRQHAAEFLEQHAEWLVPDALYAILGQMHGSDWWPHWTRTPQALLDQQLFAPVPGQETAAAERLAQLRHEHAARIADYALVQWLLAEQHYLLRERLAKLGLALYADLQVGLSPQDSWRWLGVFLSGYRMGAPPSRTNPEGQPWGYYVLNPAKLGTQESPGPALEFVRARLARVLEECDGVRIDHPHGWVDPWVYAAEDPDPLHAVQNGGRQFSSPDSAEHPALARLAIAHPDQLDRSQQPYADGWVRQLDDEQVAKYAILIDTIVAEQARRKRPAGDIACEVLSTIPYPVARVMQRHGIGRFRVTQKLNLTNESDVYRLEHAEPADWVMLGTHDTPTVWELAQKWSESGAAEAWGKYIAKRLAAGRDEESAAQPFADSPGSLVNGLFTAMLASRARHVSVFFPDLLGMTERYNAPGSVSDTNWSLRIPVDYAAQYAARCQRGEALDVARCLQRATAARGS
jgi:4-alpha-glucanotransferase